MADPLREQRAMYLAALPYPPLPVRVSKAEDMQVGDDVVTTTHTLFALCVNQAAVRNKAAENAEREKRQRKVLQEFLRALAEYGFLVNDRRLFDLYCEFSYKHLCTYFDPDKPPDVRFENVDYVSVGDACHAKLVEYVRAQGVLFKEEQAIEGVEKLPLLPLLIICRERIGRAE